MTEFSIPKAMTLQVPPAITLLQSNEEVSDFREFLRPPNMTESFNRLELRVCIKFSFPPIICELKEFRVFTLPRRVVLIIPAPVIA